MRGFLLLLIYGLLICSFSVACQSGGTKLVPSSNGKHNELTVICDDPLWENGLRDFLLPTLTKPMDGLPQAESHFDVTHVDPEGASKTFKQSKNILYVSVIRDSNSYTVRQNRWASPQLCIEVIAPSVPELHKRLDEKLPEIIALFDEHDLKVVRTLISENKADALPKSLRNLGIRSMVIPNKLGTVIENESVVVLREDAAKNIQWLLGWETSMLGNNDSINPYLPEFNKHLNAYFEGPQNGSYLAVEYNAAILHSKRTINGQLVYISRGLFRTEKGFGGGPFLLYSFTDRERQKVINLAYLVYGPSMNKRKLIMELESSLRSATF